MGISAEDLGRGYAIITLPSESINELYNFSEIEYIELPKTVTFSLRENSFAACVPQVHGGGYNLTGKGVIVGIIDSGIDYTHRDFRDENGDSRILYLWNQTSPERIEYTQAELNTALRSENPLRIIPSMDTNGHGTAVAGIASGNGRASQGVVSGVAPESSLIVVRIGEKDRQSFAKTTELMRAFKYIIDRAQELDMAVAINLSYGTNNGSHSGSSLFELYINDIARQWKSVIVAATGNEGFAGHHFAEKISSGQTIEAAFTVALNLTSMYLTFWKNFTDDFDVEIISPGGQSSGLLNPTIPLTFMTLDGTDVRVYYGQPSFYNDEQEIFILLERRPSSTVSISKGIWRIRITGRNVVDGAFNIWLPTIEEVGTSTAFLTPAITTTLTLPSTAENVISVGAYNAAIVSIADFSGRGFTARRVYVKPDLVAPGVGIRSARVHGGYNTFTGTSMAAPFVTGAAALMMEWGIVQRNDPFLYGQRVKAFLQRSAKRMPGIAYPNTMWGYGTLCVKDAMDELIRFRRS